MFYQCTYRHDSDIVEPKKNEEWLPFVRTVSPNRPPAIDSRCFSYPLEYIETLYRETACTLLLSSKAFGSMYHFTISEPLFLLDQSHTKPHLLVDLLAVCC